MLLLGKRHTGIDEETLQVRAIQVTRSGIGDAPMLPDLFIQFPSNQDLDGVAAKGAHDTGQSHDAVAARKAHAVVPPRKIAKLLKPISPKARACNEVAHSIPP